MDGGEGRSETEKNDAKMSAKRPYGPKPALAPKPARPVGKPRPPRKPSRDHIPLPGQSSPSAPPKRAPPPIPSFAEKNTQHASSSPSTKALPPSLEEPNVTKSPADDQEKDNVDEKKVQVEINLAADSVNILTPSHPERISSPSSILSSDSEDDIPVDCGNDSTPWYGVVKIVDRPAPTEVPEEEQESESQMTEVGKRIILNSAICVKVALLH